eukprot:1176346-Prorocentrum_minimum.AAC.5
MIEQTADQDERVGERVEIDVPSFRQFDHFGSYPVRENGRSTARWCNASIKLVGQSHVVVWGNKGAWDLTDYDRLCEAFAWILDSDNPNHVRVQNLSNRRMTVQPLYNFRLKTSL